MDSECFWQFCYPISTLVKIFLNALFNQLSQSVNNLPSKTFPLNTLLLPMSSFLKSYTLPTGPSSSISPQKVQLSFSHATFFISRFFLEPSKQPDKVAPFRNYNSPVPRIQLLWQFPEQLWQCSYFQRQVPCCFSPLRKLPSKRSPFGNISLQFDPCVKLSARSPQQIYPLFTNHPSLIFGCHSPHHRSICSVNSQTYISNIKQPPISNTLRNTHPAWQKFQPWHTAPLRPTPHGSRIQKRG